MNFRIAATISFLSLVLLAGCSSQPAAPEQAAAGVEDRSPRAVTVPSAAVAPVLAAQPSPYDLAALKDPKSPLARRSIHFDYDSFTVRGEYQSLLEHHARFLAANAQIRMLIQGNADERGSREYNLALGQKRADAVKRALMLLGAREDQIESVSLGEEKPACMEATESCWAQNRRGDMLYSGEF